MRTTHSETEKSPAQKLNSLFTLCTTLLAILTAFALNTLAFLQVTFFDLSSNILTSMFNSAPTAKSLQHIDNTSGKVIHKQKGLSTGFSPVILTAIFPNATLFLKTRPLSVGKDIITINNIFFKYSRVQLRIGYG